LSRTVTSAIRDVIGRAPKLRDTRSFLAALTQSFEPYEVEGRVEYTWNPRSYAGQTDLGGGVTGGQASLATRAQVSVEHALPLLDGLYALRDDADEELVEATRSIVRNEFSEIVVELGVEGGPRIARVDSLFDQLLGAEDETLFPNEIARGHLGVLARELG